MTSFTDAIRGAIQYQLNNVHTALPGVIVSYDSLDNSASVKPSINKAYSDGTTQDLPIIQKVPIVFPVAGQATITFPINAGDPCLLIFIERSTEEWKRSGPDQAPSDPRKFDLSDAIAIPGLIPLSQSVGNPNPQDLVIKYLNSSIIISQNGDVSIESSGNVTVNGLLSATLSSTGTAKVDGNLIALGRSGIGGVELLDQIITVFTALSLDPILTTSKPIAAAAAIQLTTIKGTL